MKYKHIILISFNIKGAFKKIKWSEPLKTIADSHTSLNLLKTMKNFLEDRTI